MKIDKLLFGCGIFDIVCSLGFFMFAAIKNSFPVTLCAIALLVTGSIAIPSSFEEEKKK